MWCEFQGIIDFDFGVFVGRRPPERPKDYTEHPLARFEKAILSVPPVDMRLQGSLATLGSSSNSIPTSSKVNNISNVEHNKNMAVIRFGKAYG